MKKLCLQDAFDGKNFHLKGRASKAISVDLAALAHLHCFFKYVYDVCIVQANNLKNNLRSINRMFAIKNSIPIK